MSEIMGKNDARGSREIQQITSNKILYIMKYSRLLQELSKIEAHLIRAYANVFLFYNPFDRTLFLD